MDLYNYFLGPLGMQYCNIFFAYTILSLITLIMVIIMAFTSLFKKKFAWPILAIIVSQTLIYLQNRVLYNMCTNRMM